MIVAVVRDERCLARQLDDAAARGAIGGDRLELDGLDRGAREPGVEDARLQLRLMPQV